jgi:hypothetical protein
MHYVFLKDLPGGMEFLLIFSVFGGIWLIPKIFRIQSEQRLINSLPEDSRMLSPSAVYLNLIPGFSLFWSFVLTQRISKSIHAEAMKQGKNLGTQKPLADIGIALSILSCCWPIPLIGPLCQIASFFCLIVYLVKMGEYRQMLQEPTKEAGTMQF